MQKEIYEQLLNKYPDITGTLEVVAFGETDCVYTITSNLHSQSNGDTIKKDIEEMIFSMLPNNLVSFDLTVNNGLTVIANAAQTASSEQCLDEVNIIYQGMLNIELLKPTGQYKQRNFEKIKVMDDCVKVLRVIVPIVLDKNLRVIDGELRLYLARNNEMKQVPVIVLDCEGNRADFLRLALNRSSEFQRWTYNEVDDFVDTIPQVQPLLEPLGFFGKRVLPVSFFAPTVLSYEMDQYNEQQAKYRQETGIAEWAKLMRARQAKIEEQKKVTKGKAKTKGAFSLFDLEPAETDFLPTYDIDSDIAEHEAATRNIAANITTHYDAVRREDLEAKGKWQNSRRTSSQKAADMRLAAEVDGDTSEFGSDEEPETFIEPPIKPVKAAKEKVSKPAKPANTATTAEQLAARRARLAARQTTPEPTEEFNIEDYTL
jgi:hypothetical protein